MIAVWIHAFLCVTEQSVQSFQCGGVKKEHFHQKKNLFISYCKLLEHSLLGFKFSQEKAWFSCGFTKEFGKIAHPLHNLCGGAPNLGMLRQFASEFAFETQKRILQKACLNKRYRQKNNALKITEDPTLPHFNISWII